VVIHVVASFMASPRTWGPEWFALLASVYTKHDSQHSNTKHVMVVMFGVELSTVDETHRQLKPFMESGSLLKFRRGFRKRLHESGDS